MMGGIEKFNVIFRRECMLLQGKTRVCLLMHTNNSLFNCAFLSAMILCECRLQ